MPHFENLDQYEAKNPKSGKRHIVPIAPHSLQAADYRPGDEGSDPPRRSKRVREFRKLDFEPVSIRQMEKEFKAAGRKRRRSHSMRKRKTLWNRLVKFFKSLFSSSKSTSPRSRNRKQPGDSKATHHKRRRNHPKGDQKGQQQKHGKSNRQRSGKRRKQPGQQDHPHKKSNKPKRTSSSQAESADQPARKRSRRNRRRRKPPGNRGNPPSGNQQQG